MFLSAIFGFVSSTFISHFTSCSGQPSYVLRVLNCQLGQDSVQDFQLLVLHFVVPFGRTAVQQPQREFQSSECHDDCDGLPHGNLNRATHRPQADLAAAHLHVRAAELARSRPCTQPRPQVSPLLLTEHSPTRAWSVRRFQLVRLARALALGDRQIGELLPTPTLLPDQPFPAKQSRKRACNPRSRLSLQSARVHYRLPVRASVNPDRSVFK